MIKKIQKSGAEIKRKKSPPTPYLIGSSFPTSQCYKNHLRPQPGFTNDVRVYLFITPGTLLPTDFVKVRIS